MRQPNEDEYQDAMIRYRIDRAFEEGGGEGNCEIWVFDPNDVMSPHCANCKNFNYEGVVVCYCTKGGPNAL